MTRPGIRKALGSHPGEGRVVAIWKEQGRVRFAPRHLGRRPCVKGPRRQRLTAVPFPISPAWSCAWRKGSEPQHTRAGKASLLYRWERRP